MEDKANRHKWYILVAVLIAVAAAFGIDRCVNNSSEEELPVQHPVASRAAVPATSMHKPLSGSQRQAASASAPGRTGDAIGGNVSAGTGHGRPAHSRKAHQGISLAYSAMSGPSPASRVPSSGTSDAPMDTRRVEPNHQPVPQQEEKYTGSPVAGTTSPTGTDEPRTGQRYTCDQRHLFRLGIRAGAGYSRITGLGNIVESYDVRPAFTMKEKGALVPRMGIFGTWQYCHLGAELGVDYMRLSGKLTEHKIPQDVTETTKFHYDFLTPQLLFRFYAFPKFYMGAGVSAAIPFGRRHIDFSNSRSGQVYRQQAERTQDHLRETLKARVLFMPAVKVGFSDPKSGLEAGIEYGFGINDLLHTRPNDYSYQERTNNVQYVSFTLGYSLPLNKTK